MVKTQKSQQRKRQQSKQPRRRQNRNTRRNTKRGGFIRSGSRLPASYFEIRGDESNTHNACAHAKWTGEM
jgi:hypothetical protein